MTHVDHIEALLDEHKIRAIPCLRVEQAYSNAEARVACFPAVRDNLTYFVALHEIGHIVLGHLRPWTTAAHTVLEQEGAADLWALEHARRKPTASTAATMLNFLGTYRTNLYQWFGADYFQDDAAPTYCEAKTALVNHGAPLPSF